MEGCYKEEEEWKEDSLELGRNGTVKSAVSKMFYR